MGVPGNQVGTISIKVTPDTTKFRAELRAQLEAIEKSIEAHIPVKLDLDSNGLREKVNAATAGLGKDVRLHIKPDLDIADSIAKLEALRVVASKDIKMKVEVDVDRNRIERALAGIGSKIGRLFSSIGNGVSNLFPSGGGGANLGNLDLGSFARTAAIAAAVASLAAPALALLSGALISLPGLLAGVAIPIAAVALGLGGLKKAAAVLTPDLDALKATMSAVAEADFTPQFQRLKTIFPLLGNELPKVTQGLSDMAGSFVDVVTSAPGMMNIRNTIDHIGQALSAAAPGVGSFTGGLLTLADRVAAKFPALGKWFSDTGDSFQKWVTKITTASNDNGPHGGVTPLQTGLNSLKDTVKEIMNLGGDLLGKGFDFLSDPNFGTSMKNFVADIKDLVTNVLPGLGKFFTDLSGAMHEVNTTIDKLPAWLKNGQAQPDKNTVPSIVPGLPPGLKDAPLSGPNWFTGLNLGQKLKDQFVGLNLGEPIANALEGVNNFVQAPIQHIIDFFKNTVGVGLPQAAAEIGPQVGGALGNSIQQGLLPATQAIPTQLQAATQPLLQLPAQIQAVFGAVQGAVQGSMAAVVGAVAGAGSQIVAAFSAALAQLPSIAISAFSALAGVAQGSMAQVVAAIASGGQQAVAAVQTMGQQIVATLQQAAAGAQAAGAQIGAGMAAGIRASTGAAVAAAHDLAAAVDAAATNRLGIHSPSKVFTDIGIDIGEGLSKGIESQHGAVGDAAKELAGTVSDQFDVGGKLAKTVDIASNFGQANLKQFESDIGISGNGAISTLADIGIGWGTQMLSKLASGALGGGTTIQVNSVDEALAAKQTLANKQALQFAPRG